MTLVVGCNLTSLKYSDINILNVWRRAPACPEYITFFGIS